MSNNNSDKFEAINKKQSSVSENFFLTDGYNNFDIKSKKHSEISRRINDYDYNLLEEDAYKEVVDDAFKLEYKLNRLEKDIKYYDSQIHAAFDIQDLNLIDELINRKTSLEEEYEELLNLYNTKSLSGKISSKFSNIINNNTNYVTYRLKTIFSQILEFFLAKMPKKILSLIEIKQSIMKLENINKSVDELVNLNIPYGENVNRYEQLSKYIIKANNIQTELSKHIKK